MPFERRQRKLSQNMNPKPAPTAVTPQKMSRVGNALGDVVDFIEFYYILLCTNTFAANCANWGQPLINIDKPGIRRYPSAHYGQA